MPIFKFNTVLKKSPLSLTQKAKSVLKIQHVSKDAHRSRFKKKSTSRILWCWFVVVVVVVVVVVWGRGAFALVKLGEQGWRFAKTWAQLLIRNFPLPCYQKLKSVQE